MTKMKFAVYNGNAYPCGERSDRKIILRSTNLNDVKHGFEACKPYLQRGFEPNKPYRLKYYEVICMKIVPQSEIEDFFCIETVTVYKGYEFTVFQETDDNVSIGIFDGDCYRDVWESLGMERIDEGVYQMWIDRSEAEFKTVKTDLFSQLQQFNLELKDDGKNKSPL